MDTDTLGRGVGDGVGAVVGVRVGPLEGNGLGAEVPVSMIVGAGERLVIGASVALLLV